MAPAVAVFSGRTGSCAEDVTRNSPESDRQNCAPGNGGTKYRRVENREWAVCATERLRVAAARARSQVA